MVTIKADSHAQYLIHCELDLELWRGRRVVKFMMECRTHNILWLRKCSPNIVCSCRQLLCHDANGFKDIKLKSQHLLFVLQNVTKIIHVDEDNNGQSSLLS